MSRRAETLVWERSRAAGNELLVLLAIADYARQDGRDAYPSPQLLAARSRLTDRGVRKILHRLEAAGEIVVELNAEFRRPDESGTPPRWFLHVRCVCAWEIYEHEQSELRSDIEADQPEHGSGSGAEPPNFDSPGFPIGRPFGKRNAVPIPAADGAKQSERADTLIGTGVQINRNARAPYIRKDPRTGSQNRIRRTGASGTDPLWTAVENGDAAPESPHWPALVKAAHDAIDQLGVEAELGALADTFKTFCAQRHLDYGGTSDLVRKAVDAAIWQRRHHHRAG